MLRDLGEECDVVSSGEDAVKAVQNLSECGFQRYFRALDRTGYGRQWIVRQNLEKSTNISNRYGISDPDYPAPLELIR